jgi:hypothetical protein
LEAAIQLDAILRFAASSPEAVPPAADQQAVENRVVTPAKAGVQEFKSMVSSTFWIPAFAGMTKFDVSVRFSAAC